MNQALSFRQIKEILKKQFGIQAFEILPLVGYANANYKVVDTTGKKYICKELEVTTIEAAYFNAESRIMEMLSGKFPGIYQIPLKTNTGEYLYYEEKKNLQIGYRLLTWLDGTFLSEEEHSPDVLNSFGKVLATMDLELQNFYMAEIKSRKIDWDLQNFMAITDKSKYIPDPAKRKVVDHFILQFREFAQPKLHQLRNSIIHNDANDWNVLVQNNQVSGIIDFGDMVYAPLIQELAVAISYIIFEKDDPLKFATYVIKGYHEIIPLQEKEVELLYHLIATRLCMSVVHSAYEAHLQPENEYILISEKPAWNTLDKWIRISPEKATKKFKETIGISASKKPGIESSLKRRQKHISKALSVSYHKPIKMERALFQYMFDDFGNTFLDAYNNIPHVGHQHPKVVEAGLRQMTILNTNTRYLFDQLADYAELILSKFPSQLNKIFFVNSGSAASDLAIRLAQTHTGNQNIMVMEHGYHGHTRLGVDISHYKFNHKGGSGKADYIIQTTLPDTYRGEFQKNDGSAGFQYAQKAMEKTHHPLAAFIAEPIVGCGGQIPLADGYLASIYPEVRKLGGICISDEVQTGFGRLGNYFWGFEMHNVIPDIVVLGKPMANGHPVGAVVTTDEIAESFENGMEFFSSFGGNPVSCSIGMAVLNVIQEESLQENALLVGNYFLLLLNDLKQKYEWIGDVRGSGLFLGIDLVTDRKTKTPYTELAQFLKNKMRENFILISTDGPFDNVIKMKPPLCFNKKNAKEVVDKLDYLLAGFKQV